MVIIRDIGTTVTQVIQPTAPAIAAPELMQVNVGINRQVVTKKLAGQYAAAALTLSLVDLLGTSTLTSDSVDVFVINEFGEFEIPDNGDITDLESYDINGTGTATTFPDFLRVYRESQGVQATGVLDVDVSTVQSANIAGPVATTVAGNDVTVTGATYLTDTVLAGDIIELEDVNFANATRRFRVSADAAAETVLSVEDKDPDGLGDLANGSHENVVVYRPIYTLSDTAALFFDRKTRPIDDALAAGSKTYPQPGDTIGTPSTYTGLYAFVKYTPLVGSTATWRIKEWVSNTEVRLDLVPSGGSGPQWAGPPMSDNASVRYWVQTQEPAVGRSPAGLADVYQSYDALRADLVGVPTKIQGTTESLEVFGPADPKNPLGLAMFLAATIAPNIQIMGIAVASDDVTGHGAALTALTPEEDPYDLVPLTTDPAVISLYQTHVNALSAPDERKERTLTFATVLPLRDIRANLGDGVTVTATSGSPDTLTIAGAGFLTNGAGPGDFVELNDTGNSDVLRRFRITHVVDETTVEIDTLDPDTLGDLATGAHDGVKVVSPDFTAQQKVDKLVAAAGAYADRRLTMVLPGEVFIELDEDVGEIQVGPEFAANNLAALSATVDAALPLSKSTVPGISRISGTNSQFSNIQIRELRSGGVLVLTQKSPLVSPVIDFEVTTDVSNQKVQQRSFTRLVDAMAKALREVLDQITGRERLTDEFLNKAQTAIASVMDRQEDPLRRITGYTITDFGISATDATALVVVIEASVPNVGNNIDITLIV